MTPREFNLAVAAFDNREREAWNRTAWTLMYLVNIQLKSSDRSWDADTYLPAYLRPPAHIVTPEAQVRELAYLRAAARERGMI